MARLEVFFPKSYGKPRVDGRRVLSGLPNIDWLLGDRGDDADWFRVALEDKGKRPCIPG